MITDVCKYLRSLKEEFFQPADMQSLLNLSHHGITNIMNELISENIIQYSRGGWELTANGKKEIKV